MDHVREVKRARIQRVLDDPGIPDLVKIEYQNLQGVQYYFRGMLDITDASSGVGILSPFANMNSTINVDFHAIDQQPLHELPRFGDFRRFDMRIDVDGTQLIQAMLYTTLPVVGRYMTQKQVKRVLQGTLFDSFVGAIRQKEGVMACAGVTHNESCNKSNICILICKFEVADHKIVCGVPFCRKHARSSAKDKNKQILKDKKIYLLAQPLADILNGDMTKTAASDMDADEDQFLIEEQV